jgi:8-oxo-dGTP pyrophosphatase MutT (NUDIX family)
MSNIKQQISAGAIVFRREPTGGVKFLLMYHGKGYWNFPKGHLEQGEGSMAAFLREVEEETGLKRSDLSIISGFKATDRFSFFEGRDYHRRAHEKSQNPRVRSTIFKIVILYLVETKRREITVSEEHEGFGWFSPKDAVAISKFKNTKDIIKRAYEFIEKNLHRNKAHPKGSGRHVR